MAIICVGIVGFWETVVAVKDIPHWKLPAPHAVGVEMWNSRALFFEHAKVTIVEVIAGFGVALVAGVLLAAMIDLFSTLRKVIYPMVIASQTIPIIVIAPLLLIWVGYGMQHKVIVVALVSFFPIVVNLVDGLGSADPDMRRLLRTFGANRWQIFMKAQIPASLPFLFSGIKIAITVSVIGAVIGEWVGSSEGLGYLAMRSKSQFLSERVYGASLLLSLIGIGLFSVAGMLERILVPWHYSRREVRVIREK